MRYRILRVSATTYHVQYKRGWFWQYFAHGHSDLPIDYGSIGEAEKAVEEVRQREPFAKPVVVKIY
jgi:hypothetical protein